MGGPVTNVSYKVLTLDFMAYKAGFEPCSIIPRSSRSDARLRSSLAAFQEHVRRSSVPLHHA
jgi:hypothetical protein